MKKIAILIACHNRRELTLNCLSQLFAAAEMSPQYHFQVFLLDDASTDGTGSAVRSRFPSVVVVQGDGNLFWNRGMCAAYAAATASGSWDTYALINDDLNFAPADFLEILSSYERENQTRPTIMVGPVASPSGKLLYGGYRRKNAIQPLSTVRVAPDAGRLVEIDTMNGNLVFVPGAVMTRLGGLDSTYHHNYGDIDLGYRAHKIGITILLYSRVIGTALENLPISEIMSKKSMAGRFQYVFGAPHGIGQYARFVRQHGYAPLFPLYLVSTIIKRTLRAITLPLLSRR